VLGRAKEILTTLEVTEELAKGKREAAAGRKRLFVNQDRQQLSIFEEPKGTDPVVEEIAALDLLNLTPIDALNVLYRLQQKAKDK